jgi:dihydrodipicolinate synthase/N-acetylneuraminate lyase
MVYAASGRDFALLTGTDTLLVASLAIGAAGSIAASANLVPEMGCGIVAAVEAGDLDRAQELQQRLYDVVLACRAGEPPAGWKAALELAGLCSARLAAPASGLDAAATERIRAALSAQGVL